MTSSAVTADVVLKGANVITIDPRLPRAERQGLEEYDRELPYTEAPGAATSANRHFILHSHPTLLGVVEALGVDVSDPHELSHEMLEMFFGPYSSEALQIAQKADPYDAFARVIRFRTARPTRGQGGVPTSGNANPDEESDSSTEPHQQSADFVEGYSHLLLASVHHLYEFSVSIFERDVEVRAPLEGAWHDRTRDLLRQL